MKAIHILRTLLLTMLLLTVAVACQQDTSDQQNRAEAPSTVAAEANPVSEQDEAIDQTIIAVRFIESAPKDRFIIANTSGCQLAESTIVIDLADSVGKLIFDTTGTGAGVEVFQPFEVAEGEIILMSDGGVNDGDTEVTVRIVSLAPGASVEFTIDVDDTLTDSELGMIRVSDSEISGSVVRIIQNSQQPIVGLFDSSSQAKLTLPCASDV